MGEEQENLRRNFPDFMRELSSIDGGLPDLRIAVISTSLGAGPRAPAAECPVSGDAGGFQVRPGCGLDPATRGAFLTIDDRGGRNFEGDLPTVFSCLATLGTQGCGYEHPLASLRAALAASENPSSLTRQNQGFLRKDAYLGIVILSDEDDCSGEGGATFYQDPIAGQAGSLRCALLGHLCNGQSVRASRDFRSTLGACQPYARRPGDSAQRLQRLIDVEEFVAFVKALKRGDDQRIVVSSIIGWSDDPQAPYGLLERATPWGASELDLQPVCSRPETGTAAPGIRLHSFTTRFRNSTVHSICQSDLKEAMRQIGRKMALVIADTCISAPLQDTDADRAGLQPDCQVHERVPREGGGYTEQALPSCDRGSRPCWELSSDATCGSGYRTVVRRPADAPPPTGTVQTVRCLTCTSPTRNRCPTRP